jgi:membrane protease YdiL (CAAX protease family)
MSKLTKYIARFFQSAPVLVIFAIFLLCLCMSTGIIYSRYFGVINENHTAFLVFFILFSALLFFVIPAIACKLVFKDSLHDLGVTLPIGKIKTLLFILMALLILAPSIYFLTKLPHFRTYYTLAHPSIKQLGMMAAALPLYYFPEEFYFRGFLFLGLWRRVKWHSFWITEIIFTLSHLGKPGGEILLCIPASVIFNCLTLYTRSIYPAIFVHSTIGIFCLILVNYSRAHIA